LERNNKIMRNKFFTPDTLINAILTLIFTYAWWLMFPSFVARVFIILGIILLWVVAYYIEYHFGKKSEEINDKIKNYFKKIPVISNPSFWIFAIALFVCWTYYQENQAFASKNIFIIILLIATPFLCSIIFRITYHLRNKFFSAKNAKDKIIWGFLLALVIVILAAPYLFFAYNVLVNAMENIKINSKL